MSVAELIDAAIAGRLPATELVRRLDALAAEDGAAAQHARAILAQRRRDGGVSDADYAELDALLASHFPAPDDDGTRLKPRSPRGTGAGSTGASQADASASDTGTRVVRRTPTAAPGPARAADDDGTRLVRREPRAGGTDPADPPHAAPRGGEPRPRAHTPSMPPEPTIRPHELAPGAIVKERFLLLEHIGQGGMGAVYKARDQEYAGHEQLVALKFLTGELQGRPEALRALEQEVRKTRELAHPNVVTVYEFYRDGALHFISMELLEGEPLDRLLRRNASRGLPFAEAWPIIEGAGTALGYAHSQGIIHSDFKPGNVFLTRDGRIKVLDFGIARAARLDADEFDVTVLGGLTPAYASPEMVLNLEPDPRDDVYALACVAYQLLSGKHPFDGTPAHRAQHTGMTVPKIPGLGRQRMRALEKGLAFTRDQRTPTVERFLKELRAAKQPGRTLQWSGAIAAGLLLLIGGGAYVNTWMQRCATYDAEFLDAIRARAAQQRADAAYAPLWLEQGEQALAIEEFDGALLSEGASSALGAFTLLLAVDPNDEAALDGIMRIIERYEAEAERLYRLGSAEEGLEVADAGLEIHPRHCGLNDVRSKLAALLGGA